MQWKATAGTYQPALGSQTAVVGSRSLLLQLEYPVEVDAPQVSSVSIGSNFQAVDAQGSAITSTAPLTSIGSGLAGRFKKWQLHLLMPSATTANIDTQEVLTMPGGGPYLYRISAGPLTITYSKHHAPRCCLHHSPPNPQNSYAPGPSKKWPAVSPPSP